MTHERTAPDHRRLHAAARQRPARRRQGEGLCRAEGIDLTLVRETSWANIRDRLAVGHFHVAHMLAPMPIACNLGLTPLAVPTIAPMALGLGGNAVTVSNALWARMREHGAAADLDPGARGAP